MKMTGVGHIKVSKPSSKNIYDINIAAFRRGGLGDGFIESAIIGGLRKFFPNSKITAYADSSFMQIFNRNTYCNSVVPVEWKRWLITEIDVRNHYCDLHDIWFDVKPLQFIEGKRSGEFISNNLREKLLDIESRYYFFNSSELISFYEEMKVKGQTEMFQKLFNIPVSMSDALLVEEEHNLKLPPKYAVISAGWTDTSFYKAWNKEGWEEISSFLNKNGICPVQIGKSTENTINNAVNSTHLSLQQQYTIIKNSTMFLGSDGFLTHVAAKYQIPSIVLWGITPWQIWGHPGQYDVISPKFECLWWTHYHWAHDSRCSDIMNAITVDMVKEKIELLLNEASNNA